ncbi:MAG: hypothetical protein ACJAZP_000266 [Psychromonas sp.]|jgi:hypothetical protein
MTEYTVENIVLEKYKLKKFNNGRLKQKVI